MSRVDWTKPIRFADGTVLKTHGFTTAGLVIIETPDGIVHVRHPSGDCVYPSLVIKNSSVPKKIKIYGVIYGCTQGTGDVRFTATWNTRADRDEGIRYKSPTWKVLNYFEHEIEYEDKP